MDKRKLLFIVDDDSFINMLVVRKFTSEGYEVEAFESGELCLRAIDRNPDLVILDYLFAGEQKEYANGLEIFNRIKELKPDMPVIMLSGQEKGEIVLELARKGMADYIIKDSNLLDNLHVAIQEIIGGSV